MFNFFIKRLFSSLLTLFFIITITFFLMHAMPGGPFTRDKKIPAVIQTNIENHYHLNDPLGKQYLNYLINLLQGDLGPSYKYQGISVNEIVSQNFYVSAQLGFIAALLMLFFGISAGTLSALHHNKWPDQLIIFLSTLGLAVPNFVISILLVYFLGVKLNWLPTSRWVSWKSTIMPALALASYGCAYLTRLTRSSMLDIFGKDYIRTCKAFGLTTFSIIYKHALKNALIPIVTCLGPMLAGLLTGSFVIENIFSVPGLGQAFVNSISNRDYTVIMGITIFYATLLILLNLMIDIIYGLLDPRIRIIK